MANYSTCRSLKSRGIDILELPEEIVQMEDDNALDTKLNYRLRWCRTNLKSKGLIESVTRGVWKLKV